MAFILDCADSSMSATASERVRRSTTCTVTGPGTSGAPRAFSVAGDGLTLAVHQWGEAGRPAILLVHGYPDTALVWAPVAELLAEHYLVTAYDVRGAGHSGAPERTASYRLEHLVADLWAVIDAIAPGGVVHLVGHCRGLRKM